MNCKCKEMHRYVMRAPQKLGMDRHLTIAVNLG
jgi:hypothetical protein